MADVFISYKSERRAAAEHLAEILTDYGYTVWWDYGLISGRDFGAQIEKELRAAKAVVVLWCSMSVDSEWVREEAALAKRLNRVIPTFIEKNVELPLGFSLSQTLDLADWDGSPKSAKLDRLLRDIGAFVGRPPRPNMEGLERTERAWRRFGAPPLREFALIEELERKLPPRTLPSALFSQNDSAPSAGGEKKKPNFALYATFGVAALAIVAVGAWALMPRGGAEPAAEVTAQEVAQQLQGRWRRAGDAECTTLAVNGGALSFTGPGATPFAEDIVSLDAEGAVQTDVAGTPATYRLDGDELLFTYGSGDAALRYERCAD